MVVTYDPRLPVISALVRKQDHPCQAPGLTTRAKRRIPGMKKCKKSGREGPICPWVKKENLSKETVNSFKINMLHFEILCA